ncbi:RepA plasmid replication protein [Methanonatronarchaeum thermophilum]|uniref:RepA plasmid replication protein n=1 Tax=Methanonatronarchaeum thermophilum TaxID=1927129 RepID=A0A1Y3GGK3_9EURY|nr:hypothetical protein [Methanonatronarchaeum thermophilum]OUJ19334.1 RepA plasmid replication protein [Methanonatronarchaeum thermophilum]
MFNSSGSYTGVDLDNVVNEDKPNKEAKEIIQTLDSYTEYSPSLTGFYIIVKADKETDKARSELIDNPESEIEIYDNLRFFTFTGRIYRDYSEIKGRQDELNKVVDKYLSRSDPEPETPENKDIDGSKPHGLELKDLHEIAMKDNKFKELYQGDISSYPSQSEADLALMSKMAFYTQKDPSLMENWFSRSALGQRRKWRKRRDYQHRTIDKAISGTTETYDPKTSSSMDKKRDSGRKSFLNLRPS